MWKVIPNYFGFALLRSALGCKKRPPSTHAWPIIRKPDTNGDLVTSVFPGSMLVTCICFKFYWFIVAFTFVVIGHCNCFGLGLTAFSWDPLQVSMRYVMWYEESNVLKSLPENWTKLDIASAKEYHLYETRLRRKRAVVFNKTSRKWYLVEENCYW